VQEKNIGSSEDIEQILNEINKKSGVASALATEEEKSGLVFAYSDTDEAEEKKETNVRFETVLKKEEPQKELSVPDKFEVNEKYNKTFYTDDTPRIVTTYVPTFTGASDNYRMAKSHQPSFVKVDSAEKVSEVSDVLDPTAEIDSNSVTPAVSVTMNNAVAEERTSASQVFKFVENEPKISKPADEEKTEVEEPVSEIDETPNEAENTKSIVRQEHSFSELTDELTALTSYNPSTNAVSEKTPHEQTLKNEHHGKFNAKEYTVYSQRDGFKDRFIDILMSVRVRFFAILLLLGVLAAMECAYYFGFDIVRVMRLTGVSGAMAIVELQFVLCCYLLAIPETVEAIKQLFKKKAVPELFLTLEFAVIVAYTVTIVVYSPAKYALFGLLFAISALLAVGSAYLKSVADFESFKSVSKNGQKTAIDNTFTRLLEHENAALDGVVEEHKSKTARTFRTRFVSDFFKRTKVSSENSRNTLLVTCVALGLALVVSVIAFFIPGGLVSAATAFGMVIILSCPVMSLMLHKLPFLYAVREAKREDGAFIGEEAIYDFSETDVITFDDAEVFGAEDVTLQRIMLYGRSDNLAKALRQMSALFMNVGGPLDVLFSDALDRKTSPAREVKVENSGIRGEVEGHSVLAGSAAYMTENGIVIPEDDDKRQASPYDSTKIMYASEDGEIYAKFYIRYSFSEEFSMLLPTLDDSGIKCLVYTRDPNINDELIISLTAGADKIRIMKKQDMLDADNKVHDGISVGALTYGDKSNVTNMILLSKKYSRAGARFAKLELISMGVGAALATVLTFSGMTLVPSVILAALQTSWCAAVHIMTARCFRAR